MKLKLIFMGIILSTSLVPVTVQADDTCKKDTNNRCEHSSGGWFSTWWIFNNSTTSSRSRNLGTNTSVDTEAYGSHSSLAEHAGFGGHASAHGGEGGE